MDLDTKIGSVAILPALRKDFVKPLRPLTQRAHSMAAENGGGVRQRIAVVGKAKPDQYVVRARRARVAKARQRRKKSR